MFLTTPRLLLRPAWPEDAARLQAAASWEVARQLARMPWPFTLDDAKSYVASTSQTRMTAVFIVVERATGCVLGNTGWSAPYGPGAAIPTWATRLRPTRRAGATRPRRRARFSHSPSRCLTTRWSTPATSPTIRQVAERL